MLDFVFPLPLFGRRISTERCGFISLQYFQIKRNPQKRSVFKDGQFPNNEMLFIVHAKSGQLVFANASQEGEFFRCGAFGCAFWIENISENHLRFHCNDHEYDDDFDDLIFDMIITDL